MHHTLAGATVSCERTVGLSAVVVASSDDATEPPNALLMTTQASAARERDLAITADLATCCGAGG